MYSGYGMTLDSLGLWNFNNGAATTAIIFGVDNSLSCHAENCKKSF